MDDRNNNVTPFHPPGGDFYCPSCGGQSYEAITIPSPDGPNLPTGVYRCNSCSFGFLNPARYGKRQTRSA